jgi:hypothetical protein
MAAHNTSSSEQHPLWARVLEVYESAGASGAATKTDTSVQTLDDGGITFVLRVVAALRAKPKGAVSAGDSKAAPRNPFLPPEEALAVQHLSDSHMLLLNKFNVVPHHVLVVTRAYESQADPLNSRDFAAAQQARVGRRPSSICLTRRGCVVLTVKPNTAAAVVVAAGAGSDAAWGGGFLQLWRALGAQPAPQTPAGVWKGGCPVVAAGWQHAQC